MSAFEFEQDDAEPVVALGRQHHREYVGPQIRQLLRPYRLAGIGEPGHRAEVRRQRLRERPAQAAARAIDHMYALALNHAHRRKHPQLAQPLVRAGRQIEPGRVGAIDDVEIVVAGNHQRARGEIGVARDRVQELGPLARAAGVGHVAGDQHHVERLLGMDPIQLGERAVQALVAARARPPAFDPAAVEFADGVHIRQMRDAPGAARARTLREFIEVLRLRHGRIGDRPDQGGNREIRGDQHDGVGQRDHREMARRAHARRAAQQIGARQHRRHHRQRDGADHGAGNQSLRCGAAAHAAPWLPVPAAGPRRAGAPPRGTWCRRAGRPAS